jgi:hypothetical protein
VDRPKSQYFFCGLRKKAGSAWAFADFCGKKQPAARSPCDATPPVEYLIICSD